MRTTLSASVLLSTFFFAATQAQMTWSGQNGRGTSGTSVDFSPGQGRAEAPAQAPEQVPAQVPEQAPVEDEKRLEVGPLPTFEKAHWIWTADGINYEAPSATRVFRKTWAPPHGKTPTKVDIVFAADDYGELYVNGHLVTTTSTTNHYTLGHSSGRYCVQLKSCLNVFAIKARNTVDNARAGAIGAFQITYDDGSTSLITTDSTWLVNEESPEDFQSLAYDDTVYGWKPSTDLGVDGTFWNEIMIREANAAPSFDGLSFMWSDDLVNGKTIIAARAFRRVITLPAGATHADLDIMINADDRYTLYINGVVIGSGKNWRLAERYQIKDVPGPNIVLAIYASNEVFNSYAGVLVSLTMTAANPALHSCVSTYHYQSDAHWRVQPSFEQPDFDHLNEWPRATLGKNYTDVQPFIQLPTAPATALGTPLPGAPLGRRD